MAAERLVEVLFAEDHELVALGEAVGVVGEAAALHTDGMDFLDILGHCHKGRHGTERLTCEICVKTSHYDPYPFVGQGLCHFDNGVVKELGFIYPHYFHIAGKQKHAGRRIYRGGRNAMRIVRDHLIVGISHIYGRLVDFDFLVGKLRPPEPSDQFFRLT